MKWLKWYIIIMLGLIALYMVAEYNRPRTIDWTRTFSRYDKIPYGTYFTYNELPAYFSGKNVTELRIPVYDQVQNNLSEHEIYFLIGGSVETTKTDEEELYKYIEKGNTVFIACTYLSESFEEKFKVAIDPYTGVFEEKDSATVNFANPQLKAGKYYSLSKHTLDAHFSKIDSSKATILGVNNYNDVNFIRIPVGEGFLYLHSLPVVFTNYFALKENNVDYLDKLLSYLPANPSAVYWDEYYKLGRTGPRTPLRVILTRPDLKWAYYIALFSIIIFVLFQMKRRQRIIPVIQPPANDSKEFVETVSRVYLNQKHHKNIAEKKIQYWLEFVRSRFNISTQHLSDDFTEQLAHKSGIKKEGIGEIASLALEVRSADAISADELLQVNKLIDNFYKQVK